MAAYAGRYRYVEFDLLNRVDRDNAKGQVQRNSLTHRRCGATWAARCNPEHCVHRDGGSRLGWRGDQRQNPKHHLLASENGAPGKIEQAAR
jgi:hypothetical protein